MRPYRVRFLEPATRDIHELREYLAAEGVDGAAVLDPVIAAAERLARLPMSAAIARDPHLASLGYRVVDCGRYLVFYRIIGRTVRIDRVLHSRRAYEGLF